MSRGPALPELARGQGTELLEQLDAGGDVAAVGRVDEREPGDLAEPEAGHLEDDRGQVGPQDLGVGELRPTLEVLLRVQPDRDAGLDAGRSDPSAGCAEAWLIGSIGSRCTLVRAE